MIDFLYLILGAIFMFGIIFTVRKLPGGCNQDCNQGRNCNCYKNDIQ